MAASPRGPRRGRTAARSKRPCSRPPRPADSAVTSVPRKATPTAAQGPPGASRRAPGSTPVAQLTAHTVPARETGSLPNLRPALSGRARPPSGGFEGSCLKGRRQPGLLRQTKCGQRDFPKDALRGMQMWRELPPIWPATWGRREEGGGGEEGGREVTRVCACVTDGRVGGPREPCSSEGTCREAHLHLGAGAARTRPAAGPWPSAAAGGSAGGRPRGCSRTRSGASRPSETVRQGFSPALASRRSQGLPPSNASATCREVTRVERAHGRPGAGLSPQQDAPARPPAGRRPRGQAGGPAPRCHLGRDTQFLN